MSDLTVSVPLGSISSKKRTLFAEFRFHHPCCVCGCPDNGTRLMLDTIIDFDSKNVELVDRSIHESYYVLCDRCFTETSLKVTELFYKPLRDIPLVIHSSNLLIQKVIQHRLQAGV